MEPTRRFWVAGVLATGGAVLAILLGDIYWLGIPLGITAWILADQLVFTTTLTHATQTPPLHQTLTQDTVLVDEPTTLDIEVTESAAKLAALDAEFSIVDHPAITVEGTQTYTFEDATPAVTIPLQVDVAGSYTIAPPTVTATSHQGLFSETLQLGTQCSLTGNPRVPRDIHIGTGGERIAVAAGEHDAAQGGGGFEPGELREYLPGDPTNRIDWKATARLGEPHIREAETESTRRTHLFVDRRTPMHAGPDDLTKLAHARETAIWLTEHIARLGDPLALTIVGDDDAVGSQTTDASTAQYQHIRRQLRDLSAGTPTAAGTPQSTRSATRSSQEARDVADSLTDDSTFSRTLQPYFQHVDAYIDRVTTDPLFQSVQKRLADNGGDSWLIIITDDTNRVELLETTRMAAGVDTHVSVFVLPSVLFDEQAFTDLEEAYAEYRDFEEFRQQLAAIPNTSAFEVGPHDRLAALLEAAPSQEVQL